MAKYLSTAHVTAMEPSLKTALVRNIGKRTDALAILSKNGKLVVACFRLRYPSIWILTSVMREAAREASCKLDGVLSLLLRMMKIESRNWKVDSQDPSNYVT